MHRLFFRRKRKRSAIPNLVIKQHTDWRRLALLPISLFFIGAAIGFLVDRYSLHQDSDRLSTSEIAQIQQALREQKQLNEKLTAETGTLQTALNSERAAKEDYIQQLQVLNKEKKDLLEKLKFFEVLIPISEDKSLVQIRSAELKKRDGAIQYTILLMRPEATDQLFKGQLQFIAKGAKPTESEELKPFVVTNTTTDASPSPKIEVAFQQYQRVEGLLRLPVTNFPVKSITVRVLEDNKVRGQYDVKWAN